MHSRQAQPSVGGGGGDLVGRTPGGAQCSSFNSIRSGALVLIHFTATLTPPENALPIRLDDLLERHPVEDDDEAAFDRQRNPPGSIRRDAY